eukprot:143155-Chlamydomonas_euryale.AAC.7
MHTPTPPHRNSRAGPCTRQQRGACMRGMAQGCGKTTIVEQLQQLFEWTGGRAASVSIDDFYLAHRDQIALRESHPDNRLLAMRGNAGTHDLRLGRETVEALRALMQPGASMQVP